MEKIIWFLRKYQDGEYCTLPYEIELMQIDYDKLFLFFERLPLDELEAAIDKIVEP